MLQTSHSKTSQSLAPCYSKSKNERSFIQRSNLLMMFVFSFILIFKIWQTRIDAACREHGIKYFEFTESLTRVFLNIFKLNKLNYF